MIKASFILGAALLTGACSSQSTSIPPLLQDATTTGGIIRLCEQDTAEPSSLVTNASTVSFSPEIVERLERDFPRGSKSDDLKAALFEMGFKMRPCPGALAARFDQAAGNGANSKEFTSTIVWKADSNGRLLWTTGDIVYAAP
ncbi:MAG: hypothetical protein ABJP70_10760 [Erythrobacter sp.]